MKSTTRGGEFDSLARPVTGDPGEAGTMKVERRDNETVEQLLKRFNKVVVAERITKTYREKMHFVSKSEQRKEKRRRAERNRRKKMLQQASH
jgi:small subunit ribosomal protein S21